MNVCLDWTIVAIIRNALILWEALLVDVTMVILETAYTARVSNILELHFLADFCALILMRLKMPS